MSMNLRELLITEAGYTRLITIDNFEEDFKELDTAVALSKTRRHTRRYTLDDEEKKEEEDKKEGEDDKEKDKKEDDKDDEKSGNIIVRAFKWIWEKIVAFKNWIVGLFKKFWGWITGKKDDIDDKCKAAKEAGGDTSDIEADNKDNAALIESLTKDIIEDGDKMPLPDDAKNDGIVAKCTNGIIQAYQSVMSWFGSGAKEACSAGQKATLTIDQRADELLKDLGIQWEKRGVWSKAAKAAGSVRKFFGGKQNAGLEGKDLEEYKKNNIRFIHFLLFEFLHVKSAGAADEAETKDIFNISLYNDIKSEVKAAYPDYEKGKAWENAKDALTRYNKKEYGSKDYASIITDIAKGEWAKEFSKAKAEYDDYEEADGSEKLRRLREKDRTKEEEDKHNEEVKKSSKEGAEAVRTGANIGKALNNELQAIIKAAKKISGSVEEYKLSSNDLIKTLTDINGNKTTKIDDKVFAGFHRHCHRALQEMVVTLKKKHKAYKDLFYVVGGDIFKSVKNRQEWVANNQEFRKQYSKEIAEVIGAQSRMEKGIIDRVIQKDATTFAKVTDAYAIPIMVKFDTPQFKIEESKESERDADGKYIEVTKAMLTETRERDSECKITYLDVVPARKDKEGSRPSLRTVVSAGLSV